MDSSRDFVLSIATAFITGSGVWSLCRAGFALLEKQPKRAILCVGISIAFAWLVNGVQMLSHASDQTISIPIGAMFGDLAGWTVLSVFLVFSVRRSWKISSKSPGSISVGPPLSGQFETASQEFLAAVDRGDLQTVEQTYDPSFSCIRVADSGEFRHLRREQMLSIFRHHGQPAGKPVQVGPTLATAVHYQEQLGDFGISVVTRTKDLGKGAEPMYYVLLWRQDGQGWRLHREFVHQRSAPNLG